MEGSENLRAGLQVGPHSLLDSKDEELVWASPSLKMCWPTLPRSLSLQLQRDHDMDLQTVQSTPKEQEAPGVLGIG